MQLSYKTISKIATGLRDNVYDLTTRFKPSVAYKISNNIEKLLDANIPVSRDLKEKFNDQSIKDDIYFEYEEYVTSHTVDIDMQTFRSDELGESVTLTMMELLRVMIEEPTE